jgi:argininosuccinate lyase
VAISPEKTIRRRNVIGGTAPSQVSRQLRAARRAVAQLKRKLARLS